MIPFSIYVERSAGRWEACFHSEGQTYRFTSHDRLTAIKKAVKATGHSRRDVRVIEC